MNPESDVPTCENCNKPMIATFYRGRDQSEREISSVFVCETCNFVLKLETAPAVNSKEFENELRGFVKENIALKSQFIDQNTIHSLEITKPLHLFRYFESYMNDQDRAFNMLTEYCRESFRENQQPMFTELDPERIAISVTM